MCTDCYSCIANVLFAQIKDLCSSFAELDAHAMPTSKADETFCLQPAGALLIQKQVHKSGLGLGGAVVGALGFLSESPLDGLLGVITDVVDPEKNHRIYIGTVSVGTVTFHCHSAVHEKQVRLMFLGLEGHS